MQDTDGEKNLQRYLSGPLMYKKEETSLAVFRETALMRRKKTMSSNGVPDAISTERRR
jgi:hypothetical protein